MAYSIQTSAISLAILRLAAVNLMTGKKEQSRKVTSQWHPKHYLMVWRISLSNIVDASNRFAKKPVDQEEVAQIEEVVESNPELDDFNFEFEGWVDKLLEDMEQFGIAEQTDDFSRDFIFATEAFRSLMLRSRGLDHFIQGVTDRLIEVDYDTETDKVIGSWNIDILGDIDPSQTND